MIIFRLNPFLLLYWQWLKISEFLRNLSITALKVMRLKVPCWNLVRSSMTSKVLSFRWLGNLCCKKAPLYRIFFIFNLIEIHGKIIFSRNVYFYFVECTHSHQNWCVVEMPFCRWLEPWYGYLIFEGMLTSKFACSSLYASIKGKFWGDFL